MLSHTPIHSPDSIDGSNIKIYNLPLRAVFPKNEGCYYTRGNDCLTLGRNCLKTYKFKQWHYFTSIMWASFDKIITLKWKWLSETSTLLHSWIESQVMQIFWKEICQYISRRWYISIPFCWIFPLLGMYIKWVIKKSIYTQWQFIHSDIPWNLIYNT